MYNDSMGCIYVRSFLDFVNKRSRKAIILKQLFASRQKYTENATYLNEKCFETIEICY